MFENQTALITGASRGLGRAMAIAFAKEGAKVAIVYAGNTEAAEACAEECRALGVQAKAYRCDVADYAACGETVEAVAVDLGGVDILINNAGITRDKLLLRMSEEDYDAVLDTNLKGAFNMIRHTAPKMVKKRCGRILNISSVSGLMGNAAQANYSAAKAGMIGLTKSVARELAARGITCNAIAPGFIATDMTEVLDEKVKAAAVEQIPLKKMGNPEDIAQAAVFLAGAGYITGEVLKVDGGLYI